MRPNSVAVSVSGVERCACSNMTILRSVIMIIAPGTQYDTGSSNAVAVDDEGNVVEAHVGRSPGGAFVNRGHRLRFITRLYLRYRNLR